MDAYDQYRNDPAFNQLVVALVSHVLEGLIEPAELYAAAFIANERIEAFKRRRPDWKPKTKEQRDRERENAIEALSNSVRPFTAWEGGQ